MTTALRGGPKTDAMADLLLPTMASASIGGDGSRVGPAAAAAARALAAPRREAGPVPGATPTRRMALRKTGVRAVSPAVTIPASVPAIHRASWLNSLTPLDS